MALYGIKASQGLPQTGLLETIALEADEGEDGSARETQASLRIVPLGAHGAPVSGKPVRPMSRTQNHDLAIVVGRHVRAELGRQLVKLGG